MNIGNAFRTVREEIGLSRAKVAEMIGCTPSALSKIENGKTVPKWKTVRKFIAEAHIPVAYFYSKAFDLADYICP